MIAKKMNLPWIKRVALKIYLHSPRKVQISLAKIGIKKAVRKTLKASA